MEQNGGQHEITIEEPASQREKPVDEASRDMQRRLDEITKGGLQRLEKKRSVSIYRVPHSLTGINLSAIEPEIVSIGPYHHGKDELQEFEDYKWQFLHALLRRTETRGVRLQHYMEAMEELERGARKCYSEQIEVPRAEFVEMMVLDGCFIVELLEQVCESTENDGIDFNRADKLIDMIPWLIPVLIRDLLKLENQLPFFVLQKLFRLSMVPGDISHDPLELVALKFFNHALPRPLEALKGPNNNSYGSRHLLDLFHMSFRRPLNRFPVLRRHYRPSDQSIQCVTRLRPSGIKFKPRRIGDLLDINFRKGVIEIPSITINDFTITVFINCVALELCCPAYIGKSFSAYIAFMSCLINSSRDVTLLCGDGIISCYSQNEQYIALLFKKLGEKVVFDINHCHLASQFLLVEAYYSSNWATLKRTYFSSPWSTISVFSAFVLLVFTGVQTIMAILSYKGLS